MGTIITWTLTIFAPDSRLRDEDDEIKSAYRRLAKELHPDVNVGDSTVAERFKEVSAAYAILGDAGQRGRYDRGEIDEGGQQKTHSRYEYAAGGRTGGGAGARGFRFDFGGGGAEDVIRDFFGRGRRAAEARPSRAAKNQMPSFCPSWVNERRSRFKTERL